MQIFETSCFQSMCNEITFSCKTFGRFSSYQNEIFGGGGGGCDSVVYTTAMFFSFCGHRIRICKTTFECTSNDVMFGKIYNEFKACICNIPIPLWVITGRGHFSNFEKNYPKEY